jgi:hypothetical protein
MLVLNFFILLFKKSFSFSFVQQHQSRPLVLNVSQSGRQTTEKIDFRNETSRMKAEVHSSQSLMLAAGKIPLDPRELTNVNTTRVIGGSYATVKNDADGNDGKYEVHHFIPIGSCMDAFPQLEPSYNRIRNDLPAIRMCKDDHRKLHNTGSGEKAKLYRSYSSFFLQSGCLVTLISSEITLFNAQKLLPQYVVGIIQMLEHLFESQTINKKDFVEILKHLQIHLDCVEQQEKYRKGLDQLNVAAFFSSIRAKITLLAQYEQI